MEVSPNEILIEVEEAVTGDRSWVIDLRDCSSITVYEMDGLSNRDSAWRRARFGEEYCELTAEWMEALQSSKDGSSRRFCYKSPDYSEVLIWSESPSSVVGFMECYRFPDLNPLFKIPFDGQDFDEGTYWWSRIGESEALLVGSPFEWNKDDFWKERGIGFWRVSLRADEPVIEFLGEINIPTYWGFLTADPATNSAIVCSEVIVFWSTYYLLDLGTGRKDRLYRTGKYWPVVHHCPLEVYCDLVPQAKHVRITQ